MNCDHTNCQIKSITRPFAGYVFYGKAAVCQDCGSELWTNQLNEEFKSWLVNLDINFRINLTLSQEAVETLQLLKKEFHCQDEEKFIKAIINTLIFKLATKSYSEFFNYFFGNFNYPEILKIPAIHSRSVVITNPKSLYELESWSRIINQEPKELTTEFINSILTIYKNKKAQKIETFWAEVLKPDLNMILGL